MVKKKSLLKNTYREVLRAPGRFLAILGIILLGSGFFIGLRSVRGAMVRTVTTYLDRMRFFDFQLISTLGYTDEEAEGFLAASFVEDAEGALMKDALLRAGDDDRPVTFISLPSRINLPELKEGRFPEKSNECLMDAALMGLTVGDTVSLSDSNDEDTLELFAEKTFTITGVAESPLYLNYERGATSLGSGQLAGFLYIPYEGFDADYYSTVFIRLTDMAGPYTTEYENRADELEDPVKELAESLAFDRYETLYKEAEEELADGEEEYADGLKEYEEEKADAEKELADAKQELDDAEKELEDAKKKIEDAKKEIADGERELADKKKEAETKFADAEKELADAQIELADGEAEYQKGYKEYQDGEAQYAEGLQKYIDGSRQYQEGIAAYENGVAQYEAGVHQLEAQKAQYEAGVQAYNEYLAGVQAVDAALSMMAAVPDTEPQKAELLAQKQYLDSMGPTMAETKQQLDAGAGQIAQAEQTLAATKAQLDAGAAQAAAGGPPLEEAALSVQTARQELNKARQELADARKKLDDGYAEYNQGVADLAKARNDYNTQIADAERKIANGKKDLEEGEKEYEDGLKEFEDGKKEYEDARKEADEEFAKAEEELADARQELDDAWDDFNKFTGPDVYVLGRTSNIGYACYDNDSAIVGAIARVFPVFFFLVAALICMTTIGRMVDEQRGQVGVLHALGYGTGDTMFKYMAYAGSATAIGSLLGIFIGALVIPQVLWMAYAIMYTFTPKLEFYVDIPLSIITFLAYLAAMLFVTWLSLRATLRETPASILRPKPPKAGKRVLLEHAGFIWRHLSFMWKVTMRNIFRYKARVLMMVMGVAGCTALMVTGFGIRDSISNIVEYQYDEITLYDYEVLFSEALDRAEREDFLELTKEGADDVLFVHQQSVTAANDRKEKSAYLTVVPDTEALPRFVDMKNGGQDVPFPGKNEVVINNGLADALKLSVGDTVTLRTDTRVHDFTVSGIFDNYISNYVFMDAETYRDAEKKQPDMKLAFVSQKEDAEDMTGMLLAEENVLNVTAGERLKERIGSIMDNLIYVVLLTIVCAAALAFIVIYNLTNINITERMREIATVKVLGFYPGETARYVLRENILLTVIGGLVGLPLGTALNAYVMSMIKVDLVYFTPRVLPLSFVYGIVLTAVFGLFVDFVMALKLNTINEAVALKAAE